MYNSVRGNTANTDWREFGRDKNQGRLRNIQVSQLKTLNFCLVFSKQVHITQVMETKYYNVWHKVEKDSQKLIGKSMLNRD